MTTYGELFEKQDNEAKLDAIVDMVRERNKVIDSVFEDLAKCDTSEPEMAEFLDRLKERLERSTRPMNNVRKIAVEGHDFYFVDNYSYTMYKWFMKRGFDTSFLTSFAMGVRSDKLTDKEKERFDAKLS